VSYQYLKCFLQAGFEMSTLCTDTLSAPLINSSSQWSAAADLSRWLPDASEVHQCSECVYSKL